MDTLLSLSISCVTPENYWAEYFIGFFTSAEEIDVVAKKLISSNGNFSEHDCKVRIEEVEVVGESDSKNRGSGHAHFLDNVRDTRGKHPRLT